jgi:hypothetical protein
MMVEQTMSASCKENSIDHSGTNKNSLQGIEKRQDVYLKLVPDHTWSHSLHNARNKIRANWMFMQNLNARETGISSSQHDGSFLALDSWSKGF